MKTSHYYIVKITLTLITMFLIWQTFMNSMKFLIQLFLANHYTGSIKIDILKIIGLIILTTTLYIITWLLTEHHKQIKSEKGNKPFFYPQSCILTFVGFSPPINLLANAVFNAFCASSSLGTKPSIQAVP